MDERKRITNLLIAGTLTILVLTIFLVFRDSGETAAFDADSTVDTAVLEVAGDYETDIAALQAQIETLQAQNAAYAEQNETLRAAVSTLQAREGEYQAQIEAANQSISELSSQAGSLAMGEPTFGEPFGRPHEHNH